MASTVEILREATRNTEYDGRLFLVGGYPRDRILGLYASDDVDIVLEGDSGALARFLDSKGISDHHPVVYPRFGTAMLSIQGHGVELVSARAESYESNSRKPHVQPATLKDDVFRRDFTINSLLENLHTGESLDLTGRGREDLAAGIIRTPLDPLVTFHDDPLRMLRAIRFAVRFGFEIDSATWDAVCREAGRLSLMGRGKAVVSAERIRDEFVKILRARPPGPQSWGSCRVVRGLTLLCESNLLAQFFPELLEMVGVSQNDWHLYNVWDHTLCAMSYLPEDASLKLRLGLLLHDVGKPRTRSDDEKGIHFYEHQFVGAEMARDALRRLKFTGDQIHDVGEIVSLHMRLGEAKPEWSDSAIRRLIRATSQYVDDLFELARCDMSAMRLDVPHTDLAALRARMDELNRLENVVAIQSPLDGLEIMGILGIGPGPVIREAKKFLVNAILDGRLKSEDEEKAREVLLTWWKAKES